VVRCIAEGVSNVELAASVVAQIYQVDSKPPRGDDWSFAGGRLSSFESPRASLLAPAVGTGENDRIARSGRLIAAFFPPASMAGEIRLPNLAAHSQSGGQFFGIHASNNRKIMIFAGGIPSKRDGKAVGAFGGSGGSGTRITPWRKQAPRRPNFHLSIGTEITPWQVIEELHTLAQVKLRLDPSTTRN
jgi:hypothetical protein